MHDIAPPRASRSIARAAEPWSPLAATGIDDAWVRRRADVLRAGLAQLNADYRSSVSEFPAAMQPIVRPYGLGDGPFRADATRIKQRRIGSPPSGSTTGH